MIYTSEVTSKNVKENINIILVHIDSNKLFSLCALIKMKTNIKFLFSRSTPKHADCLMKKKLLLDQIELKLDTGLDRLVSICLV